MKSKFTISIDKSIIEKAQAFAKDSGTNLSNLIESYLESLASAKEMEEEIPEEFKDLFGTMDLSAEMDEKKMIRKMIIDKHSL